MGIIENGIGKLKDIAFGKVVYDDIRINTLISIIKIVKDLKKKTGYISYATVYQEDWSNNSQKELLKKFIKLNDEIKIFYNDWNKNIIIISNPKLFTGEDFEKEVLNILLPISNWKLSRDTRLGNFIFKELDISLELKEVNNREYMANKKKYSEIQIKNREYAANLTRDFDNRSKKLDDVITGLQLLVNKYIREENAKVRNTDN